MKNNKIFSFLVAMLALGSSTVSYAQYDDLYYNPADDKITTTEYTTDATDESFDTPVASDENATYGEDDSFYSNDNEQPANRDRSNSDFRGDDYGYEYSSRIRRFNAPYPGFDFYDPIYVDAAYYDPFYAPGTNIYVFSGYNRYDRFSSYNSYRPAYGSTYYNPYNPYSSYNPYNNYGYGNSYSNNYYGNNYGGGYNPYCPPTGYGSTYGNGNNNNSNNNNGYRGARRNGEGTATGGSTSGRGQVDPLKSNDGNKKVNSSATRSSNGDNGGSSRSKYSRGEKSSGSATSGSSSRSSNKATTRSSSSSKSSGASSGSSSRSSSGSSTKSSSGSSSKKGRGGK